MASLPDAGGGGARHRSISPTLTLPPGTVVTSLVGEGIANAVFTFTLPPPIEDAAFGRKLLRLQKAHRPGRARQFGYPDLQHYWETEIRPLFRDPDSCLVRQQLVEVDAAVAAGCNRLLELSDTGAGKREKFIGDRVCEEPQLAMIVDNMRPPPGSGGAMSEFKPKWLSQSASAPAGSVRCRTCAIWLHRFLLNPKRGALSDEVRGMCRLGLCGDGPAPAPPLPPPAEADKQLLLLQLSESTVFSLMRAHPLMHELRAIQARLDSRGPLTAEPDDADFQKAMTVRDCSCYIYAVGRGGPLVSVRLGDLDRKAGDAKVEFWRRTERALIDGGFYTAARIRVRGDEFVLPAICLLSEGGGGRPPADAVADVIVAEAGQAGGAWRDGRREGVRLGVDGQGGAGMEARFEVKDEVEDALHQELARARAWAV